MAMKVFNLLCANEHPFEGWFASSEEFERQREHGLLSCPLCADQQVRKALSAPRLNLGAQEPKEPAVMPGNEQVHALLLKVAREIVATTEDVGEQFPEEARRIHYHEAPERGIRGVTSKEEARALEEEGIRIVPFPLGNLLREPLQ